MLSRRIRFWINSCICIIGIVIIIVVDSRVGSRRGRSKWGGKKGLGSDGSATDGSASVRNGIIAAMVVVVWIYCGDAVVSILMFCYFVVVVIIHLELKNGTWSKKGKR